MTVHQLPKIFHPQIRPRHIPHGDFVLDRSNHYGKHTVWAFFPGMYGPMVATSVDGNQNRLSLGQPLRANILDQSSAGTVEVKSFSGGNGYSGLVSSHVAVGNQTIKWVLGEGTEGQINWPNKQNLSLWAVWKPNGDGAPGGGDPRVISRDNGTGESNHHYMLGSTDTGDNPRLRFKINGTTHTVVVTSQNVDFDALNFIVGTYDGSTLTCHHFTESLAHGTATQGSLSGDLTDSSSAGVGLAIGANFANDNQLDGEILGCGAFDYAENNVESLRNFFRDITQIIEPRVMPSYFHAAAAPSSFQAAWTRNSNRVIQAGGVI